MNRRRTTTALRARFARETRYEVVPNEPAPFRATRDTELEQLKQRLLREALTATENVDLYAALRRAANEAAAVAWMTPFPLLFLPTLFEEKRRSVSNQAAKQRNVRARSRQIVLTVA